MDIKQLFEKQIEFQKLLGFEPPIDDPELFAHHLLGLITEVGEIAQADKRWKKNGRNKFYSRKGKKEEIADAFIFLMNVCLYSDIDSEEFVKAVENKLQINSSRYKEGK